MSLALRLPVEQRQLRLDGPLADHQPLLRHAPPPAALLRDLGPQPMLNIDQTLGAILHFEARPAERPLAGKIGALPLEVLDYLRYLCGSHVSGHAVVAVEAVGAGQAGDVLAAVGVDAGGAVRRRRLRRRAAAALGQHVALARARLVQRRRAARPRHAPAQERGQRLRLASALRPVRLQPNLCVLNWK